ncbi:MAG: hydantoinase/oxoprolinase family protein [Rhodospirillaceae bacterium]|nr:hydantoinase/oxoprolinase family protein [Rhodospirillaceae bacterium]
MAIVGIDVGGTFTDFYYAPPDGPATILKVASTPGDPSAGLLHALAASGIAADDIALIVHGTTIATNAMIERRGARCALVTTRGFRDVLELGRRDRPQMYGMTGEQRPLIPRDLRFEVTERLDAQGNVQTRLDEDEVRALGQVLQNEGVEAIVVSFLHSYANPDHELTAARLLAEANPAWEVIPSHAVCNEYFEFERTSTAAVQGYLQPLVAGYARQLHERLDTDGYPDNVLIMQSSGGVVPLWQGAQRAANIVRSGPAAGVMAAAALAAEAGFDHVITGDMGGTSFDVAVVVEGKPKVARTTKLDFRIVLKLPMIDVHTIGAGGGSIAELDHAGILQVGPRSAGADPGPACYGRGGTLPTVTDANVMLGRIDWQSPIGVDGEGTLDLDAAKEAVGGLGKLLSLGPEETAEAILTLVNHTMAGRTRLLSVEQGLDPRDFAFVAFGGAGPLHGAAIMREVGISSMLVPPEPGVLCATGCVIADIRHDLSRTLERPAEALTADEIDTVLDGLKQEGEAKMRASGVAMDNPRVSYAADMCYLGQIHTLRVPVESGASPAQLAAAFVDAYRGEFGNVLSEIPVIVISVICTVAATPPGRPKRRPREARPSPAKPAGHRPIYFGGWTEAAVYRRADLLPGMHFTGPAVVEQSDCTTIIEPGMTARVDGYGNLLVETAL